MWCAEIDNAIVAPSSASQLQLTATCLSRASQAAHLALLRDIQAGTGGFTEFVPLGFVASEAPMYKQVQITLKGWGHAACVPCCRQYFVIVYNY
jgi:hypothetical protein